MKSNFLLRQILETEVYFHINILHKAKSGYYFCGIELNQTEITSFGSVMYDRFMQFNFKIKKKS